MGPERLAALADLYDGELAWLDSQLGRLLELLEEDSDRPWLLVVTADHGEHFGEHGILGHGHGLWEETQHVPLLVVGPGIPAGEVAEPVGLQDLGSTLLAAAGDPRPLGRGRVLPGLPWSRPRGGEEMVRAEHGDLAHKWPFAPVEEIVLYRDGWKLHLAVDEAAGRMRPLVAWDLAADPREATPLPPERFPAWGELPAWEEGWWRRRRAARERARAAARPEAGPATGVRLEELGY